MSVAAGIVSQKMMGKVVESKFFLQINYKWLIKSV